ncbi:ABC transporter permease subunit [Cohnella lupini]|uniref:Putative aldouronate transport system permease protein n=1 Tax=Cohnella lupini TaxID=1294267 RepID=A0A3D9HQI0_9BACL|nr:ABC transporter permease subunit [Cohnella lupini]RED51176.1 putative aldouronate transport system permease protein [Cohnella lupini]
MELKSIKKHYMLYIMMVPIVGYFLLFAYYPLAKGLQISLQDYKLMGDRPYIGLTNYETVLHDPFFWQSLRNTVFIGIGILLFGFFAPLVVALSLNEVFKSWFKKMAQLVLYIPHLLSWVVVGGMWIFFLSPDSGLVNLLLKEIGIAPIHFMADEAWGRWVMIGSATWKDMGYNCILFLAGIVSINPSLYEAARMDGASRWQQARYVTIPQLMNTMKVIFLLNTLGIFRIFDQIFVMSNTAIANKVDVLMMYTFSKGILEIRIGQAAAASFFVIVFTLLLTLMTRKLTRFDEV